MTMSEPMETQKIMGRPPSLLPCLWSSITWCSWAGAEKQCICNCIIKLYLRESQNRHKIKLHLTKGGRLWLHVLTSGKVVLTIINFFDVNCVFELSHVLIVWCDVENCCDGVSQLDREPPRFLGQFDWRVQAPCVTRVVLTVLTVQRHLVVVLKVQIIEVRRNSQ